MFEMVRVGKTIANLREEKKLTQKMLAKILNMSPSNISNYENETYWPNLDTISKLADLFNVTTDYLLGRTDYRCPPETLENYITSDYTIHDIVNTLLTLDEGSRDAVAKYVNFLKENQSKS